jgi:hypothetical protein
MALVLSSTLHNELVVVSSGENFSGTVFEGGRYGKSCLLHDWSKAGDARQKTKTEVEQHTGGRAHAS